MTLNKVFLLSPQALESLFSGNWSLFTAGTFIVLIPKDTYADALDSEGGLDLQKVGIRAEFLSPMTIEAVAQGKQKEFMIAQRLSLLKNALIEKFDGDKKLTNISKIINLLDTPVKKSIIFLGHGAPGKKPVIAGLLGFKEMIPTL